MDEFHTLFRIPIFAMNINRSNPYIKKDKIWGLQFVILFGLFTVGFITLIYNIIYALKINDFTLTCKNGVLAVVYIVISHKYYVLLYHRAAIVKLIEDVKKDYELSLKLPERDRKVMTKYAKQGVVVCKQWLAVAGCGATIFLIKNIVLFIYYYGIGQPKLVHFFELTFPEIVSRYLPNFVEFCLGYFLMIFFDYFAAITYVAFVPLGPIFMLHACGQLEQVKEKVNNIFVESDEELIHKKIKNIIQHLNYVYTFVERIKACFKMSYELTFKATTLMIPIATYEVIESFNIGELSLEFIVFIVGGCLIISSPCFYSDLLMEKGEEVRLAIYSCGWEHQYNLRTRSTIQLLLQRALRPIAIRTLFRTVCLEVLTDIFHQSYAIFNLMNAMWK